jgi:hypothetical protein
MNGGILGHFDRENRGSFLTDHFPCATKAIWYFDGIYIPTLLIFKVFGSQV